MNIIITLPHRLANLIYEGKKAIEVRKTYPYDFDIFNDVVYVCEKGTGLVTGMFTIEAVNVSINPDKVWNEHHEAICIDKQWWDKYTKSAKKLYLWHIKYTEQFYTKYPLQKYFGIKKAPQSYVYTETEWFLNDSFIVEVETSKEKAVQ